MPRGARYEFFKRFVALAQETAAATGEAFGSDPAMATVGAIDRSGNSGGKGADGA